MLYNRTLFIQHLLIPNSQAFPPTPICLWKNNRPRTSFLRTQLFKDSSQVGYICKHQNFQTLIRDWWFSWLTNFSWCLLTGLSTSKHNCWGQIHQLHTVLKPALSPSPSTWSSSFTDPRSFPPGYCLQDHPSWSRVFLTSRLQEQSWAIETSPRGSGFFV